MLYYNSEVQTDITIYIFRGWRCAGVGSTQQGIGAVKWGLILICAAATGILVADKLTRDRRTQMVSKVESAGPQPTTANPRTKQKLGVTARPQCLGFAVTCPKTEHRQNGHV